MSANYVIVRHRRDIGMAPALALAGALSALVALPFAHPATATARDLAWLLALGPGQLAGGLLLYLASLKRIPAGRAALLGLLELVLGPIWVWMVDGERPADLTLLGGAIVIGAAAVNVWFARDSRPGPLAKNAAMTHFFRLKTQPRPLSVPCRHHRRRSLAHPRRALLHHADGRDGRAGDQGRAARGRRRRARLRPVHQRQIDLFRLGQSRQGIDRARSQEPSRQARSSRSCSRTPTSLVENFRPGTMEKLGYGWETLHPALSAADLRGGLGLRPYRPQFQRSRLRHGRPGHGRHHEHHRPSRAAAGAHRHVDRRYRRRPLHRGRGQCGAAPSRAHRRGDQGRHRACSTASSRCSRTPSCATRRPARFRARSARAIPRSRRSRRSRPGRPHHHRRRQRQPLREAVRCARPPDLAPDPDYKTNGSAAEAIRQAAGRDRSDAADQDRRRTGSRSSARPASPAGRSTISRRRCSIRRSRRAICWSTVAGRRAAER